MNSQGGGVVLFADEGFKRFAEVISTEILKEYTQRIMRGVPKTIASENFWGITKEASKRIAREISEWNF